jgi:hypothetical protein
MKVKGNESKLVKGKFYYVSYTSDDHALLHKNANNRWFVRKWYGSFFDNQNNDWNYAVPADLTMQDLVDERESQRVLYGM